MLSSMPNVRLLSYIFLGTLIIACAQQTSPTGGPKDTIPPSLEYSIPKTGQIKYKGNELELNFDELVALNNPKEQIIITPDVDKKYDIRVKKNKIIIDFEKPLLDSTTYLINFRDAVQDLTEKNPSQNLKLAFSTGNYIDSLSIRGSITDPLKNTPPKEAVVALYETDTFNIFKHKPTYLTKVNKYGRYLIQNLKPSKYFLYAFEDRNRNLIVDSKTESYGFQTQSIDLSDTVIANKILLVRLDSRDLSMTSSRPYNSYVNIKMSKGLYTYYINSTQADTIHSCFGDDRANIRIYNTFPDKDSLLVNLAATDSVGNSIDTTLYVKFPKKKVETERFEYKIDNTSLPVSTRKLTTTATFTKPISKVNFDSLYIKIDSLTIIPIEPIDLQWIPIEKKLMITKTIEQKHFPSEPKTENPQQPIKTKTTPWELILARGAFISIENDSSTMSKQAIKKLKPEDAATLLISVKTTSQHWILEVLDKSFKTVAARKDLDQMKFENLIPGDYMVRLITDSNNDGKWNPGNFTKKEQTENIAYYQNEKKSSTITLKANWEVGPLLISP
jgi:uncharacterized protein (DUF2141 family)